MPFSLQQHLPFTVLKLSTTFFVCVANWSVATAPTVYGIETIFALMAEFYLLCCVATAPTVYGIETCILAVC